MKTVLAVVCLVAVLGFGATGFTAYPQEETLQQLAGKALSELTGGNYAAFVARFDGTMKAALPEEKVAQTWKAVTAQAGAFKSQVSVRQDKSGEFDVITITCRFESAPVDVRLVFNRQRQISGLFFAPATLSQNRPQDPKKPYPYLEEEVSYESKEAGVKLAGTLTFPSSGGPFPAVLLITGSGTQNRNEEIMGHKPFLVLADYMTRRGIAVLRVDDRGAGGSSAGPLNATTANYVQDVLAGVSYLKSRKEIDAKHIGLIGHSEGGIIAPLVASQSSDIAFIVLMAGTGVPGDEVLMEQAGMLLRANGVPEEVIKDNLKVQKITFDAVRSTPDNAEAEKKIRQGIEGVNPMVRDAALGQMGTALSAWMRYFVLYDPRPALEKVKCPVLALNGEKDLQVSSKQNLPEIEKALRRGGNKDLKIAEMPGLNHLFQTSKTGSVAEYSQIEETMAPAALELISTWILGNTR